MPRLVKPGTWVLGVILALAVLQARPAHGQDAGTGGEGISVLNAVLRHRLFWMEDRTPFDPCSLHIQSGRPANFPDSIPPELRGLVAVLAPGTVPDLCSDRAAAARALPSRVVRVGAVTPADSVVQVRLHVQKGDRAHTEDYTVKRGPLGGWNVVEVRMWGHLYVVPARRARESREEPAPAQ